MDRNPRLNWSEIDTVLCDMDGTLLDLAFDNHFWLEYLPGEYGRRLGMEPEAALATLTERYQATQGQLDWYCIDHWTRELEIDIRELKGRVRERIAYLPQASDFLSFLRDLSKRVLLVTNAHPDVLQLKVSQTQLAIEVDELVSSHSFDLPKEHPDFWGALRSVHPFDPDRTLIIEDNVEVLRSAQSAGIANLVAVSRPDWRRPKRMVEAFPAVEKVADLIGPSYA